jgi:hypothetical protein
MKQDYPNTAGGSQFSHLDEENLIKKYLAEAHIDQGFCVDIAASDGITMSNTYALYKAQWSGLAVECDPWKFSMLATRYTEFPRVRLAKCMVTPENILALLDAFSTPARFDFLNLDIDGYDFFVLREILSRFRPSLICTEINEKIPPPVKFTVRWDPNYCWSNDHFYGQSISMLHQLCVEHSYSLVELHYNNAFLVPAESSSCRPLGPEEVYREGYLEMPDRREKFPWNANVEEVLHLPPEQALAYLNTFFKKYSGMYDISL